MSRHTVTEKELDDWLAEAAWRRFAGSFGDGSSKSLETDGRGVYRVIVGRATVFLGADKSAAIAAYNEAR